MGKRSLIVLVMMGFVRLAPGLTWSFDQVTSNGEPDIRPSMATIKSAHTMGAYTHDDGDFEAFASGDHPGDWIPFRVTENSYVDISTDVASIPELALIHISIWWQDPPYQGISYGKGNPLGWSVQPVTSETEDASWPSIEIDQGGFIHMVYQKLIDENQEIFYTDNITGSWVHQQATYDTSDNIYPWFDLDGSGEPHVVFSDGSALYYIQKSAGDWSSPELIATGADTLTHPYVVLDGSDKAHVVYSKSDGADHEIYYASDMTGIWQEEKVTDNEHDDLYPTLFSDPNQKVHIVYMADEPDNSEIYYANNASGSWDMEKVTDNQIDDKSYCGRYFFPDPLARGQVYFWNDQDGDDEIYRARSKEPLYTATGLEETPSVPNTVWIKVSPNPFPSHTSVCYTVSEPGKVSLKVYDATGCLVKILADGFQGQGEHQVNWDGSIDGGSKAASGVYFFRLDAVGKKASAKGILK